LAINVDQHWPAGHWRAGKQIGTRGRAGEKIGTRAVLDDDRWEKISVFVAFGAEESNASALVALSDVSAGGVVERRLLRGWSFQQRLEPCK
jgi:hypothetical protein